MRALKEKKKRGREEKDRRKWAIDGNENIFKSVRSGFSSVQSLCFGPNSIKQIPPPFVLMQTVYMNDFQWPNYHNAPFPQPLEIFILLTAFPNREQITGAA